MVFNHSLEEELVASETRQAQRNLELFDNLLQQRFSTLSTSLEAWSKWDDMVDFVLHPTESFRETNFNFGALDGTKADIFIVFDKDGKIVDSLSINREKSEIQPLDGELQKAIENLKQISTFHDLHTSLHAYLRHGNEILMLSAASVTKTSISEPANGTAVMGQFLMPADIEEISSLLHVNASFQPPFAWNESEAAYIERTPTEYVTFLNLRDISGVPISSIKLNTVRDDYLRGKRTRDVTLAVVAFCGLLALIGMILLMKRIVSHRFRQFKNQLKKIADNPLDSAGISLDSTDEFRVLAEDVNCVLGKLFELRDQAANANSVKSQFLANMSHEVRTPINGVSGMLDLLATTPMNTEQKEFVSTARSSIGDLLQIVSDILDFSKIEARKLTVDKAPFSLKRLLQDILLTTEVLAERKGVTAITEIDPSLPENVCGDRGKLKQIVLNLLTNAVKFTSHGGVVFQVRRIDGADAASLQLEFSVSDTGVGFEMSDLDRLFQPFEQGQLTARGGAGGTGLGLTISRQLAELLGGTLSARSIPAIGSCFILTLPVEISKTAESPIDEVWEGKSEKSLNILVAEDNKVNQLVMRKVLEKLGHTVTLVDDGAEAVQKCREGLFDLVLMDIQMPRLNGMDAFIALQANPATEKVPVIAVTAHAGLEERQRCLEAGMKGYVTKPLRMSALIESINSIITSDNSHL